MNKAELVQAVAERAGSSPAEARRHVDAVLEEIVAGVADGERVSLVGFGTFDSAARAARTARNPRTGAAVDVPATVVPRFRVGAGFKERVAGDGVSAAAATPAAPAPSTTKKSSTKADEKSGGKGKKSGKPGKAGKADKDSGKKSGKTKGKKSKKK